MYDVYQFETGVFTGVKGSLPNSFNNFFTTRSEIITLDIKIIIIKQEMLEPFQITQSELMGQYFQVHLITMLESQIR